jgi:hypothetical protein
MKVVKAPNIINNSPAPFIFLAGSIEMNTAEDWQKDIEKFLEPYEGTLLNPRRDHWDSSWKQSVENKHFVEQVEWELYGLEVSDLIVLYFDPNTKSPITLLELGLYAKSGKLMVCCPEGYWRRGNVEITCKRYSSEFYDTMGNLKQGIIDNLDQL